MCISLASLPKDETHEFHNIRFLACSNKLTAVGMVTPLVEDLCLLERGVVLFDAMSQSLSFVIAPVLCMLCDNVRASKLINHLGSKEVFKQIFTGGFQKCLYNSRAKD